MRGMPTASSRARQPLATIPEDPMVDGARRKSQTGSWAVLPAANGVAAVAARGTHEPLASSAGQAQLNRWTLTFVDEDLEAAFVLERTEHLKQMMRYMIGLVILYTLAGFVTTNWSDVFSNDQLESNVRTMLTVYNVTWVVIFILSSALLLVTFNVIRLPAGSSYETLVGQWLFALLTGGVFFGNRWRCGRLFDVNHKEAFASTSEESVMDQFMADGLGYQPDSDFVVMTIAMFMYLGFISPMRSFWVIPLLLWCYMLYAVTTIVFGAPGTEGLAPHQGVDALREMVAASGECLEEEKAPWLLTMAAFLYALITLGTRALEGFERRQFYKTHIAELRIRELQDRLKEVKDEQERHRAREAATALEKAIKTLEDMSEALICFQENSDELPTEFQELLEKKLASPDEEDEEVRVSSIKLQVMQEQLQQICLTLSNKSKLNEVNVLGFVNQGKLGDVHGAQEQDNSKDRDIINFLQDNFAQSNTRHVPRQSIFDDSASDGLTIANRSEAPSDARSQAIDELELHKFGTSWDFNTLELCDKSDGQPVLVSGMKIFTQIAERNPKYKMDDQQLQAFLLAIQKGYRVENRYHNATHATQVANHLYFLANSTYRAFGHSRSDETSLKAIEQVAAMVAAYGHDVAHPGYNNQFSMQTLDETAITYNDRSVLENMHAAVTYRTFRKHRFIEQSEFAQNPGTKAFRVVMLELILATDMKQHFDSVSNFRLRRKADDFDPKASEEDKMQVIRMCMRGADIGHSALPWAQHREWSLRVTDEFFSQGDRERELGLPISPLCDRTDANLASSQKGFLNFVCKQLFEELYHFEVAFHTGRDPAHAGGAAAAHARKTRRHSTRHGDGNSSHALTPAGHPHAVHSGAPVTVSSDEERSLVKAYVLANLEANVANWEVELAKRERRKEQGQEEQNGGN